MDAQYKTAPAGSARINKMLARKDAGKKKKLTNRDAYLKLYKMLDRQDNRSMRKDIMGLAVPAIQ